MNYTREQRSLAWDKLSDELREFALSDELTQLVTDIAKKNNLLLDKAGILDEQIHFVLLGLTKSTDFQKSLAEALEINQETAGILAEQVNQSVFSKAREALKKQESESQEMVVPARKPEDTREQILSEIENPTPVRQPVQTTGNSPAEFAHDFINAKLTAPVSLPSQKTNTELQKPAPKPVSYSTDPYREPLN